MSDWKWTQSRYCDVYFRFVQLNIRLNLALFLNKKSSNLRKYYCIIFYIYTHTQTHSRLICQGNLRSFHFMHEPIHEPLKQKQNSYSVIYTYYSNISVTYSSFPNASWISNNGIVVFCFILFCAYTYKCSITTVYCDRTYGASKQ